MQPLREAACQHGVTVVCGVHEHDRAAGGDTLYNAVVIIGPDGTLLNRHHKLTPSSGHAQPPARREGLTHEAPLTQALV